MIKNIKNKIQKKLAVRKLKSQYENILVVENIMEDWLTQRILEGQQNRRKELIEKQGRIKEIIAFIEFLNTL